MLLASSSPLLTKQGVKVYALGESVVLTIGNAPLSMHYEQALALSRWIRQEAKAIKRLTTRAKTMRSLGVMHDADAKPKPLPYQRGVAIHVKDKQHSWNREDVWSEGRLVATRIGRHTFKLHFENALKIAQWLRLRAKEAKSTAGDPRHWSEI